jgi:hypothetical protein
MRQGHDMSCPCRIFVIYVAKEITGLCHEENSQAFLNKPVCPHLSDQSLNSFGLYFPAFPVVLKIRHFVRSEVSSQF